MATRSPVPGLAEKQCHDVAHRPPHILSQLHRPLLVFIFLSRSFICRDPYVSHLFGRCSLLTGACCISTSIAARSWGIRPPHISHIYASRTLDIDHSPRKATDENDAGIVVPDKACTAPPFRTPFARCSSFVSTPSALMVSALTIAARSSGRFRPPPLPSRVMVTCLCKRMRKKEVRNHKRRGAKITCRLL